jgi:hypothetical protein
MADELPHETRDFSQGLDVNSGVNTHALQHVDDILSANVSRSARRERTCSDAADGCVETRDASGDTG